MKNVQQSTTRYAQVTHPVSVKAQQTRYVDHVDRMLVQWWSTVYDVGPTLNQHWVNLFCVQGNHGNTAMQSQKPVSAHMYSKQILLFIAVSRYCRIRLSHLHGSSVRHILALPCKAKRQYRLTFKVSRYCILALQSRAE